MKTAREASLEYECRNGLLIQKNGHLNFKPLLDGNNFYGYTFSLKGKIFLSVEAS